MPSHRNRRWRRLQDWFSQSDTGAVTAEFASVLPAVLIMAVLLAALGRGVMVSVNCQDAASAAARTAISTGDDDAVKAAAQSVAGQDAEVDIDVDGGTVTVVTRCPVIPDPMGVLPSLVKGEAVGVLT